MGDLSAHFSSKELECSHCGELVIKDALIVSLEGLRSRVGRPIRVTSGYRCPEHNKAVGGAPKSKHVLGEAADIAVNGLSVLKLAAAAEWEPGFDGGGIGMYPESHFVHVDVRNGAKRWLRLAGKYYYF